MENKHVFEQLPAYALGALDEDEKQAVESHLITCKQCQDEFDSYQDLMQDLAFASLDHQPPAQLKQRIMAQVVGNAGRETTQPQPLSLWEQVRLRLRSLSPAWAFASLVVIALLVVSNLVLWGRLSQEQPAHRFQFIAMTGTEDNPDANAVLVVSSDGHEGTLVVEHLPELDESLQYQLWLIRDGIRTDGGVFSVSTDGYGYLEVIAPESLLSYDAFGVTIEPFGGSPGPTGTKVLGSSGT